MKPAYTRAALGAVETRREMLKESQGLSLVDPYMAAYVPNHDLETWAVAEKQFFLTGDLRLRPRGLLFDDRLNRKAGGIRLPQDHQRSLKHNDLIGRDDDDDE